MRWLIATVAICGGCSTFLESGEDCTPPEPPFGIDFIAGFQAECADEKVENAAGVDWVPKTDLVDFSGSGVLRVEATVTTPPDGCGDMAIATCGETLFYSVELDGGDFALHMRAEAPNSRSNTVWLEIDGGNRIEVFLSPERPGLRWFEVGAFTLTALETVLAISTRELGVSLDAIGISPLEVLP